ncbi:MAG: DUF1028 domain-containing protein, partial [Acidobacteriota bacterium]|nr:DUF1028 domain-containing protein [Acidobacteriota bacterium]
SSMTWAAGGPTLSLKLPTVSTFSIVAIDPSTGQMGVAVASRYFSVGSVVPWAEAGVGAIATQANVNVGYGPKGLKLLDQGMTARQVLDRLLAEDKFPGKDGRQIAIVDAHGNLAAYTGPHAPDWHGDIQGKTWSAQGNILVGPQVIEAIGKAFEATQGELSERLFAALAAGESAGGDRRGRQSASILVVCKECGRNTNNDRWVFVNVDDNPRPLVELRRLLDLALAYNYQDRTFKLVGAGKLAEARAAAEKAERYMPDRADTRSLLGFLNYAAGNKPAALAEFRKAQDLDPEFRQLFEGTAEFVPAFKGVLEDRAFLDQLFSKKE